MLTKADRVCVLYIPSDKLRYSQSRVIQYREMLVATFLNISVHKYHLYIKQNTFVIIANLRNVITDKRNIVLGREL